MEVTCERCSTVYDFDDALVSERGTTVKCTTCGHQFKVRRAGGASVPEKWTVRTVDGRELDFAALRELQAAIHEGKISREDVLSRGNSRPRRLGSIAELDPFFSRMGMTVPGTGGATPPQGAARSRSRTPPGLGGTPTATPVPGHVATETSAVFTLPPGLRAANAAAAAAEAAAAAANSGRRSSIPPPPVPVGGRRTPSVKPPAPAQAPKGSDPLSMPASPRVPSGLEDLTTIDAPTLDKGPRAATASSATGSPMFPPPSGPMFPPADAPATGPESSSRAQNATPTSSRTPQLAATPSSRAQNASAPLSSTPETPEKASPPSTRTRSPGPGARSSVEGGPSSVRERPPVSAGRAPTSIVPSGPVSSRMSLQPGDEAMSDPRVSGAVRRGGAGRWLVGFVLAGLAVFGAVTVGRKYLPQTTTTAPPQEDARIAALLEQGERDLREGDLEAAKESLDKASALSDKDPKIAARLAHLAAVRADIPWLLVRLLPEGDPDGVNARRELDIAVTRARQAADRAQALAPQDTEVTRSRIDALRLAGDLEGARKLVATLPKASAQPESDMLLAALDLAEAQPSWPTVIERLRNAARAELNLGRARAMLVYALARSGDAAGAKSEFERLAALPRPHPLTAPLRSFLGRAESDAKKPDAADAGAVNELEDGLRLAEEARTKGDVAGAQSQLEALAKKNPGNARVLTALGDLATQRRDRAGAIRYYEQAVAADKSYLPALAGLADLRWENGERQTASQLYRQIIERGGEGSPYTKRAKDRFSKFADVPEDEGRVPDDYVAPGSTPDRSDLPGGAPAKPKEAPTPTNSPAPPGVDTSDLPGFKP
ncbi:zinc-ribbon domain-containing protein [Polyangium aurulentum]|uniref:zinc-ribbon domain-containing protein n=1 Tax=Polyangium aurulentum TaxID=2567896 RepID=UPI0010ADB4D7|nr:zinc-ribbon domain-containing protein [Polyangium aurulentum]UQA62642.1 zinc-ribbon domain-containing protein [Polyangium aurulentum]